MTRVPVFVRAEVLDSADRAARPSVDLMAQEVATRIRARLWSTPDSAARAEAAGKLPPGEQADFPIDLDARLWVVARRGGVSTWRPPSSEQMPLGSHPSAQSTDAVRLLADALRAVEAEGGLFVPDDLIRGDSLAFELRLVRPVIEGPARVWRPMTARNPAPAFTALVPWEESASPVPGTMRLRYPSLQQNQNFQGYVVLQFVVDSAGRAEPGTVRDLWPASQPRLAGNERIAYEGFVAAARRAVLSARFRPATIAGCPVRQLVQQPVGFELKP